MKSKITDYTCLAISNLREQKKNRVYCANGLPKLALGHSLGSPRELGQLPRSSARWAAPGLGQAGLLR